MGRITTRDLPLGVVSVEEPAAGWTRFPHAIPRERLQIGVAIALLCLSFAASTAAAGADGVLTPVSVSTASIWEYKNGYKDRMIDGSGLSGAGAVETWVHDDSAIAATMWHAGPNDGGLGGPTGSPPPVAGQAAVFDLGGNYALEGVYVWNHNQAGATGRGVDQFELLVSSSDTNPVFTPLGSFTLGEACGCPSQTAELVPFTANDVRLVKLVIASAHSGQPNDWVGLSEVRFLTRHPLVTVRGETSWEGPELVVRLVADVPWDPLRSFGIGVDYDAEQLHLLSATRDGSWYAGHLGDPNAIAYAPPAISPGGVALLGARLDLDQPTLGVQGTGAPLAEFRFQSEPGAPLVTPITLSLARPGTFANFVTVDELVLDDGLVAFEDVGGGDGDADGILDAFDRCPHTYDPNDVDSGGVYSPGDPDGDTIDGVGDVCQCGSLDDDGRANATDVALLRGYLAGLPGAVAMERCDVVAPTPACDLRSWVVLARAGAGLAPGVMQVCTAAVGGGS